MSTYLAAYEDFLTAQIEAGGDDDVIDKVVKAYNNFHRSEFDTWLTDARLTCQCGKDAVKEKIEPLEEIACVDHRPKAAT